MTHPPSNTDFAELIGYYEQLSVEMTTRSEQLQAALAAAGTTVTRPTFTLTVTGVQVTELRFTDATSAASPVQLREELLTAYAECLARANNAQANAISRFVGDDDLAQAVRGTVPEDVRDRTPDLELEVESSITAGRTPASGTRTVEDFLADPALDDAIISADRDVTMSDVPEWEQYRQGSDPSMWQYELEQQTKAISERAGELRTAMEQVREEAESPWLVVQVNAAGRLVDLRLREAFRSAEADKLSEDFARLYATATTAASRKAMAVLTEGTTANGTTQGTAADDPTAAYLGQVEATFQARLDAAEPGDATAPDQHR